MRVIGVVPVKNEADNWLDACLAWTENYLDDLFVYDDQSDDDSLGVALKYTPHVVRRADSEPSFLEHEGQFRQNAWNHMERSLEPEHGDWVLSFDADEFLVGGFDHKIRERVVSLIEMAEDLKYDCVEIARPEVWQHDTKLMVRVDRDWQGRSNRFAFWKPGLKFKDKKIACGSLPAEYKKPMGMVHLVSLMHFAYSTPETRQAHYDRYTAMKNHGHSEKHIQSILEKPTLVESQAPAPKIWKGVQ